jgi:hypothetical protein
MAVCMVATGVRVTGYNSVLEILSSAFKTFKWIRFFPPSQFWRSSLGPCARQASVLPLSGVPRPTVFEWRCQIDKVMKLLGRNLVKRHNFISLAHG